MRPLVKKFTKIVKSLTDEHTIPIIDIIDDKPDDDIDNDMINVIRNQLIPNGLTDTTKSDLREDMVQLVELMGNMNVENSISRMKLVIKDIHKSLDDKIPSMAKSWLRLLIGIH